MTTFRELNIDDTIVSALDEKGFDSAFPIQEQAIPLALKGNDIIGQAKTGTGKTLGFGLPVLQELGEHPEDHVQALVVVPTRELAQQVYEDLLFAASHRPDVKIAAIYGGKSYDDQIAALNDGAQIVVGTPGRLLDLNQQHILQLGRVRFVVLDEADKMLDLGFLPDVERIFSKLPDVRQTMLFSATMPGAIVSLSRRFMTHPIHVQVVDPDEGLTQANIDHFVYRAHPLDKDEIIGRILQAEGRGRTVIFTRTKRAASRLADELDDRGFKAVAVHGDLNQDQRERNLNKFRNGEADVLVATDVAARGIDVDDVTHVINHSIPEDEKDYLHRVGRTGRAGKHGIAVTFVDWEDVARWGMINKALDFGQPEPTETYSTSPHLFSDLSIPEDATGRLKASTRSNERHSSRGGHDRGGRGGRDGQASHDGRRGGRGGNGRGREHGDRDRHHDGQRDAHRSNAGQQDETKQEQAGATTKPRRRRRRRSHGQGGEAAQGSGQQAGSSAE
ncbi:DEAD/DEAH box helicase [Pseudoclavibacter sp. CFCC 11306]|uniref:DEAD/DEAH box helicase n=1 Tax=Pseudoclavibacter sp. CFCC 11306 TaxID=1564493 RepID=UPI0013019731|nr:DEAD/DEAH box helicase [Pseudoclavibacter sp. CFCC 11306]KAB1657120.1 DEAD/DEAH box helicase [Pseudoclavibacter sp. CFCC 11306]